MPAFAETMVAFYRHTGIVPPTAEEIANVPPWTKEEADAFERAVKEAGGQVEDTPDRP